FFFSSRRRHTRFSRDWSSDVCSSDLKVVPVISAEGQPAVMPTIESVLDRSYAISRPLFMYTNGEPVGEIKAYLDWIKGDEGQKVLFAKGYVPLRVPKK